MADALGAAVTAAASTREWLIRQRVEDEQRRKRTFFR